MNITVERLPKCLATLHVDIPADAVTFERETLLKTYASKAKIPGFRPGKAPKAVIAKKFQKEIEEEMESDLVNRALETSIKQEKLKVLDFGTPSDMGVREDGSFGFKTNLVLAPDLVLPDYKNIAVSVKSEEVTEEEISKQLEDLQKRFAEHDAVEGRAIAMGDMGVIDFHSTIDGVKLEEALGKPAGYLAGREGFWIRMEDDAFLPGFATQLVGTELGAARDVDIVIPEDFPMADLVGKTLRIHVVLKEIKQAILPQIDDAFAAKLMGPGKTTDDLRSTISDGLATNKKKENIEEKIDQIVSYLSSQVEFEIPEDLLMSEAQRQTDQMVQEASKSGMSDEEIMEKQEDFFAQAQESATTNIKTNFILQEIASVENVTISDSELVNHLAYVAQQRKEDPIKFIKGLQRGGRLPGIRNSLLVNKVLDFLVEQASVSFITE